MAARIPASHAHEPLRGGGTLAWVALALLFALGVPQAGAQVLADVLVDDRGTGLRSATPAERTQVSIRRDGHRLAARPAQTIALGDEIVTGERAYALLRYPEGHEVLVLPGTRLRLGGLLVYFGELFVRARGFFRVETAYFTAGVEGTEFVVRAGRGEHLAQLIVIEGAVRCSASTGSWEPVRIDAAQQLTVRAQPAADDAGGRTRPDGAQVLLRSVGEGVVEKLPAPRTDVAQISQLVRELDAYLIR